MNDEEIELSLNRVDESIASNPAPVQQTPRDYLIAQAAILRRLWDKLKSDTLFEEEKEALRRSVAVTAMLQRLIESGLKRSDVMSRRMWNVNFNTNWEGIDPSGMESPDDSAVVLADTAEEAIKKVREREELASRESIANWKKTTDDPDAPIPLAGVVILSVAYKGELDIA